MGRIPGTYNKREGAPKEHETLVGRSIDRALRPLFPKGFVSSSQVGAWEHQGLFFWQAHMHGHSDMGTGAWAQ